MFLHVNYSILTFLFESSLHTACEKETKILSRPCLYTFKCHTHTTIFVCDFCLYMCILICIWMQWHCFFSCKRQVQNQTTQVFWIIICWVSDINYDPSFSWTGQTAKKTQSTTRHRYLLCQKVKHQPKFVQLIFRCSRSSWLQRQAVSATQGIMPAEASQRGSRGKVLVLHTQRKCCSCLQMRNRSHFVISKSFGNGNLIKAVIRLTFVCLEMIWGQLGVHLVSEFC